MECFDPASGAWEAVAPFWTKRSGVGVAVLQGKLYAVGGLSNGEIPCSLVEAYDPQQNRWEAAAPLSGAHMRHIMALL